MGEVLLPDGDVDDELEDDSEDGADVSDAVGSINLSLEIINFPSSALS